MSRPQLHSTKRVRTIFLGSKLRHFLLLEVAIFVCAEYPIAYDGSWLPYDPCVYKASCLP